MANTKVVAILGTLCLFFTVGFSDTCDNVLPVSHADQQNIVALHNDYRKRVTTGKPQLNDSNGSPLPRAVNMKPMTWSNALAKAAGQATKTCQSKHLLVDVPEFKKSGQNMYFGYTLNRTVCNYTAAFLSFTGELKAYRNSQRRPFVGMTKATGHFTQVIWAQTTSVGCACSSNRKKDTKYPTYYTQWIACNYGLAGNVKSTPGFETSIYDVAGEKPSSNTSTYTFDTSSPAKVQNQSQRNPNSNRSQNGQARRNSNSNPPRIGAGQNGQSWSKPNSDPPRIGAGQNGQSWSKPNSNHPRIGAGQDGQTMYKPNNNAPYIEIYKYEQPWGNSKNNPPYIVSGDYGQNWPGQDQATKYSDRKGNEVMQG